MDGLIAMGKPYRYEASPLDSTSEIRIETPTAMMSAHKIITDKRIIRESPPDILLTNYNVSN